MGNINNPCVNRWGLNSMWNRYWYADSKYALFLQQDDMFSLLLKTYIDFGGHPRVSSHRNPFWCATSRFVQNDLPSKDYRWVTIHERELNYFLRFRLRLEAVEKFQSTWTILRFNSYVVINASWFQPDKQKNKRSRKSQVFKRILPVPTPLDSSKRSVRTLSRVSALLNSRNTSRPAQQTSYLF